MSRLLRVAWNQPGKQSLWQRLPALPKQYVSRRHYASSSLLQKSAVLEETTEEESIKGIAYADLTIGIPKERFPRERRVAATPESVARLVSPGFNVQLESQAGAASYFSDADYAAAGATIVDNVWKNADIILKVHTHSIV